MGNEEILKLYRQSPIQFIHDMWGLVPERDNKKFIKGKHISWQQHDVLLAIEKALRGEAPRRISISSGHGIGKSSLLSWVTLWYLFSFPYSQVPCTAPTGEQMYDVLWKEISKWKSLMPSHIAALYDWTAGHVRMTPSPETWFARAKTARKETPEALAGIHGDYVMMAIDEASGIANEIFTTAEGALTNENILVIMCSNPTRTIGYFYDSHHSDKANWQALQFNSEDSPLVDNQYVKRMEEKFGRDSDEFGVRVAGRFPRVDSIDNKGYVPLLIESDLKQIRYTDDFYNPKRLGVDPSGSGSNKTIWVIRDKFKAKIYASENTSTPKSIAQKTLTIMSIEGISPENTTVDNFGEGANVSQYLAAAGKFVNAINVGDEAEDKETFMNKRAETYWRLKEWIRSGGELVEDERWKELLSIRYRSELSGKLKIMSKDEMRKEGYASPDVSDALSLTFCQPDSEYYIPEDTGTIQFEAYDRFSVV